MITDHTISTTIDIMLIIAAIIFIIEFIIVCGVATFITVRTIGWKALLLNIPIYVICAGKLTFIWLALWVIGYVVKQL